jgi:hypothetical protein
MGAAVWEPNKKAGVSYAFTDDGLELPVIDVTHPSFSLGSDSELATAFEKYSRQVKVRARLPSFARAVLTRWMIRRSALVRAAFANRPAGGDGTYFLTGTATYLMKLPPDLLGAGYARRIDRKLAAEYPPLGLRFRLRATAELLAECLATLLARRRERRVELINIGGGPAIDSVNALILVRKEHPELLAGRSVHIHVLDREQAGPRFGERALAALRVQGAPLYGVDVGLNPVAYDWADASLLRNLLDRFGARDAIVAASSEGALFDYGSDQEITDNLAALRDGAPPDAVVVGSVTRDRGSTRLALQETKLAVRPLGLEAFGKLVASAGWRVERAIDQPASHVVRLGRLL